LHEQVTVPAIEILGASVFTPGQFKSLNNARTFEQAYYMMLDCGHLTRQ
jgi:hypothetical protein